MRWTGLAFALWMASAAGAVAQEAPAGGIPPAPVPGPPVAAAPAEAAPNAPPSFSYGTRLGLLMPLRDATASLPLDQYAPLMADFGLDLGWYPTPWLWTGLTAGAALGCETVFFCDDEGVESQALLRLGLAATFRLLGGATELWVGSGVNGAWLTAGPWELGGLELTLPRVELSWPGPAGRLGLLFELTAGRFRRDSVTGAVLPAQEQTLHATAVLAVRFAWEPRLVEGATMEGAPVEVERGFLLSGRLGGAVPLAQPPGVAEAFLPVQLALGYRFSPRTWASAFLEFAPGAAASCAPATACNPSRMALGLQVELHPLPSTWRDPWIGVGGGLDSIFVDRLEAGVPVWESWDGWMLRLEGGVQLVRWTQATIGAWISIDAGQWLGREVDVGGASQSVPVGASAHAMLQAGLRVAWLP